MYITSFFFLLCYFFLMSKCITVIILSLTIKDLSKDFYGSMMTGSFNFFWHFEFWNVKVQSQSYIFFTVHFRSLFPFTFLCSIIVH